MSKTEQCRYPIYKCVGFEPGAPYELAKYYYWCAICKHVRITAEPWPKTEDQMVFEAKQGRAF